MPRPSPSSSVTSLPSPNEGNLYVEPHPSGDISSINEITIPEPYSRSNKSSRGSSPSSVDSASTVTPRAHTTNTRQDRPRFHPYKATSHILHLVSRSFGLSSPSTRTLEEVKQAKPYFIGTLTRAPSSILQRMYAYKLAQHICIAERVALNLGEFKSRQARKELLISVQEHRGRDDLAANEEAWEALESLLGIKGLTVAEVEGDEALQQDAHRGEVVEFAITHEEVGYIEEAVKLKDQPRGDECPWDVQYSNSESSDDDDEQVDSI